MQVIEISQPGGAEVLRLSERDKPLIKSQEVLVQVKAAGVNRPDIMQRLGFYPPPEGASELLGLEVAGVVVEVGDAVTQWQVGDEVCALSNGGGYAEFTVVPEGQCLPIPKGLSFVEAASLPETYFTVWSNVVDRGQLKAGESFLVHGGSSGIGVSAIQLAKAMGAKVYATAGSGLKCKACEALGAELAVNYKEQDFLGVLSELMPQGIDVILDMVGADYIAKNMQLAAEDGRIINVAYQNGFDAQLNFLPVLLKRLTLTASTLRPRSAEVKAGIAQSLKEHVWPLLEQGKIKPVIAQVFPFSAAADAHRLMESSEHVGKIILQRE